MMVITDIVNKVNKAVEQLIGRKEFYTKKEFIIIYTGAIGLDVNLSECQMIFRDQEEISFHALSEFLIHELSKMWDPEMKALELFQKLDKTKKYFIEVDDIIASWKEVDCKLPLDILRDCFYTIAPDGTLDYFNFKNMYLRCLSELNRQK